MTAGLKTPNSTEKGEEGGAELNDLKEKKVAEKKVLKYLFLSEKK